MHRHLYNSLSWPLLGWWNEDSTSRRSPHYAWVRMGKIARISKNQGASRSIGLKRTCMSSSSPVNQIRLGTSTSPDGGKLIARANWWQSTKIHQHVFTWQWTLSVLSKEEMLLKLPNGSMALLQPWDYNNLGPPPFPHHNVQLLRNPHVWNLTEQQSQFLDWVPQSCPTAQWKREITFAVICGMLSWRGQISGDIRSAHMDSDSV